MNGILKTDNELEFMPVNGRQQYTNLGYRFLPSRGIYSKYKAPGIASVLLILRLLMSYIYMEHLFLMFLDHTQRRTTVGRTPLDE